MLASGQHWPDKKGGGTYGAPARHLRGTYYVSAYTTIGGTALENKGKTLGNKGAALENKGTALENSGKPFEAIVE